MSTAEPGGRTVALALLRARQAAADELRHALQRCGLQIAVDQTIGDFANGRRWQHGGIDLLLLDLERAEDDELDVLEALLEGAALPMIFHDGQARTDDQAWLQRLVAKIRQQAAASSAAGQQQQPAARRPDVAAPSLRCWVLGASFGGPEALKRFLRAIPQPPPATAFIIGQHIGDGFVDVLASQLNRATSFKVAAAADGARLESGCVVVAPVRERLRIDAAGRLRLAPETDRRSYMPSIDRLMEEVALRFGTRSGAIVFSGMGDDGTRGSIAIARAGGIVWAQDAASSAIDSMPNCARAAGIVQHSGSPEELAAALVQYLAATAPMTAVEQSDPGVVR